MSETGFLIDGNTYPVPGIPDMDMDELQVVYEACGITLQGWARRESEDTEERREWEDGVKNPHWMRALLHVAYQRGNPDVPSDQVAKLVAKVKWLDATLPMMLEQEAAEPEPADPNPVGAGNAPEPSSKPEPQPKPTTSETSPEQSQNGSRTSSDQPDAEPATTGTSVSGSEPGAVPLRQVV